MTPSPVLSLGSGGSGVAAVYTYVGNTTPQEGTAAFQTSQGVVQIGQSGLFLPAEVQSAAANGIILTPGPSVSPTSQLTAPLLAAGAAGSPNGVYRYAVTFTTAVGETLGLEIGPITLTNVKGSLTALPLGGSTSGVTGRKIYRTLAGGATGTEKLVATIADNTTTTLLDNVADGALGATIPTTDTSFVAVNLGKFDFEHAPVPPPPSSIPAGVAGTSVLTVNGAPGPAVVLGAPDVGADVAGVAGLEQSRAVGVEGGLSTAVASEVSRAIANEATKATMSQAINPQIGTTYTLALSDWTKIVTFSNASASPITFVIPLHATLAINPGFWCDLYCISSAGVVFAPAGGVALPIVGGLTGFSQGIWCQLVNVGLDSWILKGLASQAPGPITKPVIV